MTDFTNSLIVTGIFGFLIGWSGTIAGIITSSFTKAAGQKSKGILLGLLGGLTLGIICFELLPEAFKAGNLYIVIVGIILGLIFAVILDGKLENANQSISHAKPDNFFKIAVFMAVGLGIHNLPNGIALGSILSVSLLGGLQIAIALIFDGIPEGLTLGILLNECNAGKLKLLLTSIVIALPMGIGTILGSVIKSPVIICISLAFASAMILYVTLRETLPAANNTWNGRTTTIGNVAGIIIGMLIIFGIC